MKKFLLILSMFCFLFENVSAQEATKKTSEIKYIGQISAGVLGGSEFTRVFHVRNGISFANHFAATVGLGVESYYFAQYMPIYLDFRYTILKRRTSPFVSISSGYLQPLATNAYNGASKGGFTGGAKVGLSHFFSEHVGLETSLGYRYSRIERKDIFYTWDMIYLPYTTEYNMNRFELSVGLIFK